MSWYDTNEQQNAHVLWSKVRYMRNIAALPFFPLPKEKSAKFEKISKKLHDVMGANGFHEHPLPAGICPEALSLAEKQFVDYSFAVCGGERSLYFNEPCNLTIYSGGDFHLNVQALLSGLSLCEAHKIACEAEEMLDREFDFAYSDKLGYLASDVALCGSCLELSLCLYLPAAKHGTRYADMQREAAAYGATISPFLAKYDNAGDLYVLSYLCPRSLDEKKAILDISMLVNLLIDGEIHLERALFGSKSAMVSDRAWRALGLLATAKSIDEDELLSLLSRIRLSLALDSARIDAPPSSISLLNTLLCEGLSGSVASISGTDCRSLDDCRAYRAIQAKNHILPLCSQLISEAI